MSAITLNGTTYEADLTDLAVVRDLLLAYHAADTLNATEDPIARLEAAVAYAENAKAAVSRAIGAEPAADLFGDGLPLPTIMAALTALAQEAGPAFDAQIRAL